MTRFRDPPGPPISAAPKAAEAWLSLPRLREGLDPTGLLLRKHSRALLLTAFVLYCRAQGFVLGGRASSYADAPGLTADGMSAFTGLPEAAQGAALEGLLRAGIVHPDADLWRLSAEVLQPDPQRSRVRWDRVVQVMAGDGDALLVAWGLAELIVPPWTLTPVALRMLGRATQLSFDTIRHAQRRLIDAGLLERKDWPRGGTPRCVFTPMALGLEMQSEWKGGTIKIGNLVIRLPETRSKVEIELKYDPDGRAVWRIEGLEIRSS